eukprot:9069141-Pyramimonas_sp.AAC.1
MKRVDGLEGGDLLGVSAHCFPVPAQLLPCHPRYVWRCLCPVGHVRREAIDNDESVTARFAGAAVGFR